MSIEAKYPQGKYCAKRENKIREYCRKTGKPRKIKKNDLWHIMHNRNFIEKTCVFEGCGLQVYTTT